MSGEESLHPYSNIAQPGPTTNGAPPSGVLLYQNSIVFLREACSRSARQKLDGYLLSISSAGVVGAIARSLECRKILLETSSEIGLLDDLNLRKALNADERSIATLLVSIFDSKSDDEAVLRLEGDSAQCFLDVVQNTLDRGLLISPEHSSKARRIIRKLSESCDKLPSSLFITGIAGRDEHPTFGGGFGDIYRASYGTQTVALKRMRHFLRGKELHQVRLKFCREALVWKDLHHPYILSFIGIDRDSFPSFLCMVSPWMEHGTVLNYLKQYGYANVNRLLFEIAQGLEYLHSHNIVHGDLRGSNILINDDWSACLADFGLSRFTDTTTSMHTSNRAGSTYWMAPELIAPEHFDFQFSRTAESDVYAFGCVCLELYTGRPPFSELSQTAALLSIIQGKRPGRPAGPPTMSDALWQCVTACWAEYPAARPITQAVVHELSQPFLNQGGSTDLPTPPGSPGSPAGDAENLHLLDNEADINAVGDQFFGSVVKAASVEGATVIVRVLLERGADVNAEGGEHGTALQIASAWGHADIVRVLLEQDADVDAVDAATGTALQAASRFGHTDVVQVLLEMGANVNYAALGGTALHIASATGEKAIVQILLDNGANANVEGGEPGAALKVTALLQQGANVDPVDVKYATPLQVASWCGHADIVRVLLENGANVDHAASVCGTALRFASGTGRKDIVQILLASGANVDAVDTANGTALQAASRRGHTNVVRVLLENGANVNAVDAENKTALQDASGWGHTDTVRVLLEKGANVNHADLGGTDIVQLVPDNGTNVNAKDEKHGTALHIAARQGYDDIVQILLENGANVDAVDAKNKTALQDASGWGRTDVVRVLLEKGANVDASDEESWTALQRASNWGHIDNVRVFLEKGANVNHTALGGGTALHRASDKGHTDIVQLLLANGTNVNAKDEKHGTALHIAARQGYDDIVQILLENGANVDAVNAKNGTALQAASGWGRADVVRVLLENGANINASDKDSWTALQRASRRGHADVVRVLLKMGANVDHVALGGTALHIASREGKKAIVQILLANGANVNAEDEERETALQTAVRYGHEDIVQVLLKNGAKRPK